MSEMGDNQDRPLPSLETEPGLKHYQSAMPKLDLAQNTKVFIRVNPLHQQTPSLQGEFLGTSHYEFMILRLPSVPGLLNKLLPQIRIEIRYMQEGAVHSFVTELISYIVKPTLLLFTSYPDRMSIMDTRKHQRVMCALPILLHSNKGVGQGLISDLSLGGCRIGLELTGQSFVRELELGEEVLLQTILSADGLPCGVKAIVRNLELIGTRMAAGLSFMENQSEFLLPLTKYVKMVQVLE